jgi:CubicO group peptidase (beta-lactamase class C family)
MIRRLRMALWLLRASALLAGMLIGVSTQAATPAGQPGAPHAADKAAFDAMVEATVARYRLPGIAVGVIEDGNVVYTRTVGETAAGSGDAITTDTLFKIASNSKAMTASTLAVIALLLDAILNSVSVVIGSPEPAMRSPAVRV